MTPINWHEISSFDYIIAGILTIFLLRGLCMGFVRQLAAAAALIGSSWLAGAYAGLIRAWAQQYLPLPKELVGQPAMMFWLSSGTIYLLFILIFFLIGKLLQAKSPGWTDRMAGGLLGIARGAFVIALLFMFLAAALPASHPLFEGSLAAPYLGQGTQFIRQFIRDAAVREDLRPKPPETADQPEYPPPPADGTLVMPDAIPDQDEPQLLPPSPPQDNSAAEEEERRAY